MIRVLKIIPFVLIFVVSPLFNTLVVHASSFDQNDIIDDAFFNDVNSIPSPTGGANPWSGIDNFLNSYPSSCISQKSGFVAADPTGYSPTAGFTFGGNVTAGQIIYDASMAYGISPEVLITTMQKEQSLITGGAGCYNNTPNPTQTTQCNLYGNDTLYNCTSACPYSGGCINIALSYGCPGNCNAVDEGFSSQVIHAAWKLKFVEERSEGNINWAANYQNFPESGDSWNNSDDPQTCYNGAMTAGNWQTCPNQPATYWDGTTTIQGTSITIDNGATAALYSYTPTFAGGESFDNTYTNTFGFGDTLLGCGTNETPMPQVVSMYNPKTYDHFYTDYACEANFVGYELGYIDEGAVYNTTPSIATGAVPVWRLYNSSTGTHLWTISQTDINNALTVGYKVEGIAFYVVSPSDSNIYPVYRYYNPTTYQHIWTLSTGNSAIQQAGYRLEGPAFYSQ